MPITVEVVDDDAEEAINAVYSYFEYVDEKFSTYKDTSEISQINKGLLKPEQFSSDMNEIFDLSQRTKEESHGYFDISRGEGDGYDPSGIVKGWAIYNAAKLLQSIGFHNFFVDAGGDIQVSGKNAEGKTWTVGIRDPFDKTQQKIVKKLFIQSEGVATSGTYIRGQHIYNPKERASRITDIVSLTVIGPNVYEADRFATAAFAMGRAGIQFIEGLEGFEGYLIDTEGIATMTSGFERYTKER